MANKRTLKKEINYVAGELLSECLCNKYLIPGTDAEKVDALMGKIIGNKLLLSWDLYLH